MFNCLLDSDDSSDERTTKKQKTTVSAKKTTTMKAKKSANGKYYNEHTYCEQYTSFMDISSTNGKYFTSVNIVSAHIY